MPHPTEALIKHGFLRLISRISVSGGRWRWYCQSDTHTLKTIALRKKFHLPKLLESSSWPTSSLFHSLIQNDIFWSLTSMPPRPCVELPNIKHCSPLPPITGKGQNQLFCTFSCASFPTTFETCSLLWDLQQNSSYPFFAKIKLFSLR